MDQLADAIQWEWAYQFWLKGRAILRDEHDTPSRREFVQWVERTQHRINTNPRPGA